MLKSFGQLFFINLSTFGLWLTAHVFSQLFPDSTLLRLFESSIILAIIFPLTGLNLTLLVEKWTNQNFDIFERLTIIALFSFTVPPLLLLGEYTLFHTLSPSFPLFNTATTFLLASIFCPFQIEKGNTRDNHLFREYTLPFLFAALIFLLIIGATVSAYYPLPDSDPYYWFTKIQDEIITGHFPEGGSYRPLLSYLAYPFVTTAHVDLYAFFKYIMPCLILLTIFPASLISKLISHTFERFIFLLLPLSSASSIIYFLLPIPQALINIIITFFIFLSLHALFTKNHFFSLLAGTTLLAGYFYHDISLLFFFPWLLCAIIIWRKQIWEGMVKHKFFTFIVLLATLPYIHALSPVFNFFKNWLIRIVSTMHHWEPNFSFPLAYVNVDGKAVGWGDWIGVIKYYLFYGGPILLTTTLLFLLIIFSSNRRKQLLEANPSHWEITSLLILFFTFFSLAEILPRFFGIALLPERALSFVGLISTCIIPLVYILIPLCWRQYITWFIFIALIVNVGGALYINSLKKDLISPMRIASMQWIKNSLPENRIIIVQNNLTIMKTFSQTESILEIPHHDLYTDITVFNELLEQISTPSLSRLHTKYREYLDEGDRQFDTLQSLDPRIPQDIPVIKTKLEQFTNNTSNLLREFPSDTLRERALHSNAIYIYYARQEDDSLYSSRPYYQGQENIRAFAFDTDKRFEKIYNDTENQIFIWKLKLPNL